MKESVWLIDKRREGGKREQHSQEKYDTGEKEMKTRREADEEDEWRTGR